MRQSWARSYGLLYRDGGKTQGHRVVQGHTRVQKSGDHRPNLEGVRDPGSKAGKSGTRKEGRQFPEYVPMELPCWLSVSVNLSGGASESRCRVPEKIRVRAPDSREDTRPGTAPGKCRGMSLPCPSLASRPCIRVNTGLSLQRPRKGHGKASDNKVLDKVSCTVI